MTSHVYEEPLENVGSLVAYFATLEPLSSESRREPCDAVDM